jgi:hypothetical protein
MLFGAVAFEGLTSRCTNLAACAASARCGLIGPSRLSKVTHVVSSPEPLRRVTGDVDRGVAD